VAPLPAIVAPVHVPADVPGGGGGVAHVFWQVGTTTVHPLLLTQVDAPQLAVHE